MALEILPPLIRIKFLSHYTQQYPFSQTFIPHSYPAPLQALTPFFGFPSHSSLCYLRHLEPLLHSYSIPLILAIENILPYHVFLFSLLPNIIASEITTILK